MPRRAAGTLADENAAPPTTWSSRRHRSGKLSGFGLTSKVEKNSRMAGKRPGRKGLGGATNNRPIKQRKLTQPKAFSFATDERLGPAKLRTYSPPPKDTTDEDLIQAASKIHKEGEMTMPKDFNFATDERILSDDIVAQDFVPLVNQVAGFWDHMKEPDEECTKGTTNGVTQGKTPKLCNQGRLEDRPQGVEFEPSVISVKKFWGTMKQPDPEAATVSKKKKHMNRASAPALGVVSGSCTIPKPPKLTRDGQKQTLNELTTDERIALELAQKRKEKAKAVRRMR